MAENKRQFLLRLYYPLECYEQLQKTEEEKNGEESIIGIKEISGAKSAIRIKAIAKEEEAHPRRRWSKSYSKKAMKARAILFYFYCTKKCQVRQRQINANNLFRAFFLIVLLEIPKFKWITLPVEETPTIIINRL